AAELATTCCSVCCGAGAESRFQTSVEPAGQGSDWIVTAPFLSEHLYKMPACTAGARINKSKKPLRICLRMTILRLLRQRNTRHRNQCDQHRLARIVAADGELLVI